jgi:hypothetical protein
MMAETKQRRKAAPAEAVPQLANLEPFEERSWLKGLPPAFADLVDVHTEAVRLFEVACADAAALEDEESAAERDWQHRVHAAVAAGNDPPPKDFADPAVRQARIVVSEEQVERARDELGLVVVGVLGELRARRSEVKGSEISEALAASLNAGLTAGIGEARERLRRQLAELERDPIPDVSQPTDDEMEAEHVAA